MEKSLPLHQLHANSFAIIINRSHSFLHFIAILFLLHYRLSFFFQTTTIPTLPWLLIFASELLLSLSWLLSQSYRWRPVYRTVFPERLPGDDELPGIDVFICTADPDKEPTVEVMNTVISALAMDYPPEKLHVYVSDDAGSDATLRCTKVAWEFATCWVPFCRKYGIDTGCPEVYFSSLEDDDGEFKAEREKMEQKYEVLKQRIKTIIQHRDVVSPSTYARDHPAIIEVINEYPKEEMQQVKLPLLVYVSREKRPSHHHNFKAGALNVLLRVSATMSNSPYILVLDCDMYCNDPTSARQAMCYYCDPRTPPSIAFVLFPQTFRNIGEDDIYDSEMRSIFKIYWHGLDGVGGTILSGCNFYIKREALLGNFSKQEDLVTLRRWFGPSNDFIKTLVEDHTPNSITDEESSRMLLEEANVLASCSYENQTAWGSEVGFLYFSVVEDYFTGYTLHRKGWKSVYLNPKRPQVLGTSTTNFNDLSVQWTRWTAGIVQIAISRFCPLICGPLKMSLVHFMCYLGLTLEPLLFCFSLWGFALVPQLCLFNGIPLYPKVSDPNFNIFSIIFVSAVSKSFYEIVVASGGELRAWRNEWRIWMMKAVTSYTYGSLEAVLNKLGMKQASFSPTNKVTDVEQVKLYEKGVFDFRAATMFLAPLVTVILVNIAALVGHFVRCLVVDGDGDGYWEKMAGQMFLSIYILVSNYAVIEGMIIRRDKASIPLSVTLLSGVFSVFILLIGSAILC
ncbi:cellulose synthase like G2, ARABIDOPSIS THALIANA CELLULOSE SYNTHASE LIKE G2 [Hibiscus trionum]|uniref:Cellulose synthase like G2, ARABIDOPSIS THALIANA CELLULOSE SYNTHASE LIKE G2 n=1 Tax=Hibiscus trionum TaxID=183268 RepID=A0A9W7MC21_HIBTR|nr:cellulose synthase like G2, ARABIDOPSIS THALIANA CELLULOSE SYNTHASE LIKE G2 [Hibiscus trionum]